MDCILIYNQCMRGVNDDKDLLVNEEVDYVKKLAYSSVLKTDIS